MELINCLGGAATWNQAGSVSMFKNPPYVSLKYNNYIANVGLIIEQNIYTCKSHIVLLRFFSLMQFT